MQREIRQLFYFDSVEKNALVKLSKMRGLSQSDIIRLALRNEAQKANVWPVVKGGKQHAQSK